jgi:hypothetical protein
MNIALLRCYVGDKENAVLEIVSNTPPERDPFLDLQIYLTSNRIKFVNEIPYAIGLFCFKNEEGDFEVINNTYTPDWEIPDEKPPLMSTYYYTLKWLKIPEPRERSKESKEEAAIAA